MIIVEEEKMEQSSELDFYEKTKNWSFDEFEIETEKLTDWDLYEILNKLSNKETKILDLGTGGGEKVLKEFPECAEIIGTDFSQEMINTANNNLRKSGRKNISFRLMDNLNMDVPNDYFDIVVARNTVINPQQIYDCLKPGGYLLIRGVDNFDCWSMKMLFGMGQGYNEEKPISIVDYENVINAGFKNVELVPIHEREYFKDSFVFKEFLKKVPILKDFSETDQDIDDELLEQYIRDNIFDGKIRLLREYYGITAQKLLR